MSDKETHSKECPSGYTPKEGDIDGLLFELLQMYNSWDEHNSDEKTFKKLTKVIEDNGFKLLSLERIEADKKERDEKLIKGLTKELGSPFWLTKYESNLLKKDIRKVFAGLNNGSRMQKV
jgi:hypothetical protein